VALDPGEFAAECVGGRGFHSSTFQLNLSRLVAEITRCIH